MDPQDMDVDDDLELQLALALIIAEFQAQPAGEQGSRTQLDAATSREAVSAAGQQTSGRPAASTLPAEPSSGTGQAASASAPPPPAPVTAPTATIPQAPAAAYAPQPAAPPAPSSDPLSASLAAALQAALQGMAQPQAQPPPPAAGPTAMDLAAALQAATAAAQQAGPSGPSGQAAAAAGLANLFNMFMPQAQQQQAQQQQQAYQQQQQQQQQQQHVAMARRPVSAVPAAAPPLPAWAAPLRKWHVPAPEGSGGMPLPETATATVAEVQEVVGVLSKALTAQVQVPGVPVTSTAGLPADAEAITLKAQHSAGGLTISRKEVEALLGLWVVRPRQAASSKLRALQGAFNKLPPASTLKGGAAAALQVVAAAIGHMAFEQLRDDEDDLYYEKGQATSELIADLKTPGAMSPGFLDTMVCTCTSDAEAAVWVKLMRSVLSEFKALVKIGGVGNELEPLLLMLDTFTSPPRLQKCLVAVLLGEVTSLAAKGVSSLGVPPGSAKAFEAASIMSAILQISSLVDPLSVLQQRLASRAKDAFSQLKGYPTNYGETEITQRILNNLFNRLQDAGHLLLKRLITIKDGNVSREVVLSWLALVARINAERNAMGERGLSGNPSELMSGSSDGLMVNLTAIMLRFCRPFVSGYLEGASSNKGAGSKFGDLFDKHLTPDYYRTQAHRLPDIGALPSLGGERGTNTSGGAGASAAGTSAAYAGVLPEQLPSSSSAPSFMADVFFLTQRLVRVGFVPAVFRYQQLMEIVQQQSKHGAMDEDEEESPRPTSGRAPPLNVSLLHDCTRAQLLDPTLAEDMVQFSLLQLAWLRHLISTGQHAAFQTIPEYVLSDALTWLDFVIRGGQAVTVASKPIGLLMSSLVALLDTPGCVCSTLMINKIVMLLLGMLGPQLDVTKRTIGGGLGRTVMRPGEAALVTGVLGTAAVQEGLVPALMRAYVGADFVVGLDVDRDRFDKFTMRNCIDMILEELWRDDKCRRNIVSLAAAPSTSPPSSAPAASAAFSDYVGCALNGLIYLFKDSLDRLHDIHQLEVSRADAAAWSALPSGERTQKEEFYRQQQRTCSGFMRMAVANLKWLNTMATDATVVQAFLRPPIAGRTAYAIIHFLELLIGPRCQHLTVERPEQYHFDKAALMESMMELLLRLGQAPAFVGTMAEEPDLDVQIFEQVHKQLEVNHQHMLATRLRTFLDALASSSHPAKRQKSEAGERAAAAPFPAGIAAEAAGQRCLALPELPDEAAGSSLDAAYPGQLEELTVGPYDSSAAHGYNRHFAEMASSASGDSAAKMKRLTKELRDLNSRTRLPCHPAASIFLRHDGERIDKMRAIITGPEGTPYEGGCFVFDIFFPSGYPNVPPLMVLDTTGQGRVRFNPNLYADGKVCLSLLGTWHGGHESEKWNPSTSSLFQILVSIQGMILVEDPYFNEPAVDAMRSTQEGKAHSAAYNAELQLGTLRWAMIDVLKNPPPGFEEVVRLHFKLLRRKIMSTVTRWVKEAGAVDAAMQERMDNAACELHARLAAL